MRFYIPGTTSKKEKKEDGEDVSDGEEAEEQNAAQFFYETLMDKAEIGEVAGDTFATFLDILHLTPRSVRHFYDMAYADFTPEDASISTCTKRRSGCVVKRTITRFSSIQSRSSWYSPNQTTCIPSSQSAWILHYGKVRRDIHSWSCSSSETRKSTST
jgi:hypothetical protein